MLALKFHEAKALLLWVVILSHFLTGSFTYTCSPSYSAFTLLQANFWKMDICSQIPLSTTYRLSSGASVSCPTLTTMGGNNIHTNPLAQALCVKSVIPSIPIPYKDSSSSGCPGARMATTNEATTHQNAICATLLVSDIVDTSDGGSIRGSPFGICTVLSSDPGSPGTDILCMEYTIEIEIVSSGELVCSSPCQTCSGTASFCLTCQFGFPLFYNNYCYSDCPSGSYQSSMNSCTSCSSPCDNCDTSPTTCTSCLSNYPYFSSDSCFPNCPFGTYESSSYVCSDCSDPCETCSGSPTTCLTCLPTSPLFYNSYCYPNCPSGSYQSSPTTCQPCAFPCQTCQGSSTTCTSCVSSYPYLSDGKCSSNPVVIEQLMESLPQVSSVGAIIKTVFTSGGALAILTGLLNKLLSYIKYINIEYSVKLESMLQTWGDDLISFDFLPDVPPGIADDLAAKPLPHIFVHRELAPTFLENFWEVLLFLGFALIVFVSLSIIIRVIENKKPFKLAQKVLKLFQSIALNFIITQLYFSLGDTVLFFVLEMRTLVYETPASKLSFYFSIIFLGTGLCVLIFHVWVLKMLQKPSLTDGKSGKTKEKGSENKFQRFDMLFEQWKNTSFIHSSYLLMFSLRDILLNIVISTLFDHPLIQAILFMIITTSFLLYLVIYLPFKKNYENFQQIFLEIIVMLTYLSALIMTATQSTTHSQAIKDSLGQFIMIMAIIFNVAIMAFVVWEILVLSYSIYIAFKEWRKRSRSKKIQPHLKEIDLIYKQKKDDHSFTSSQMTIDNSLKEKSENFSDPQTSVPYYPWRMGFNYYERKRVNRPTRFPSWQENIFYQSAEQQTSNYGLSEETNSINHDQNFLELKEKSRRNDTTLYDQIVSKIEQKIDESNSFGSESIQKEIVESKSDSGEFENDNKVQKKTILKRRRTPFNQPVLDLSEISPHR